MSARPSRKKPMPQPQRLCRDFSAKRDRYCQAEQSWAVELAKSSHLGEILSFRVRAAVPPALRNRPLGAAAEAGG